LVPLQLAAVRGAVPEKKIGRAPQQVTSAKGMEPLEQSFPLDGLAEPGGDGGSYLVQVFVAVQA
jgi:hypothetical protein